jgi:predicted dehydrogenase
MIGTDGHQNVVLNDVPRVPGCEVVAYSKSRPEDDSERLYRLPNCPEKMRIYDHYTRMLEEEELDVVCVCLPYAQNAGAAIASAARGIHVICEKPLATEHEALAELRDVVNRTGVQVSALLAMRCGPCYRTVQDAIRKGRIGKPILATGQKSYRFGTRPDFYRKRETYGGTIPWVAVHAVDFVRWTTGLEYARVSALHANLAHPDYPGCEDSGGLLFEFKEGGQAVITFDYLRPPSAPSHGDDRLRVAGSLGVIEIKDLGERVELIQGEEGPRDLPLLQPVRFFVDFSEAIHSKKPPVVPTKDSLRITEVCLKARDAADRKETIEL